jgi:hypothetical protein
MRIQFLPPYAGTREVIDEMARQYIAQGIATLAPLTPGETKAEAIAELTRIANRKPKATGNRKLSKSEILALYKRDFNGAPYAYGKTRSIVK